jgi:hypothetical protein
MRSFVGGQFDDADGVVNGFDRSPEIESANDDEPAFEAALDERGTMASQDGYASRCRTFAGIKGTELDGELVGTRVAITDQFFCSGIQILLGTARSPERPRRAFD